MKLHIWIVLGWKWYRRRSRFMFHGSCLIINRSTWTALVTAVEALLIVALIASIVVGDLGTRKSLKAHFMFISDDISPKLSSSSSPRSSRYRHTAMWCARQSSVMTSLPFVHWPALILLQSDKTKHILTIPIINPIVTTDTTITPKTMLGHPSVKCESMLCG